MSHRWDCPDEGEARRKARSDASFDAEYGHRRYSGPYDDCEEAQSLYRREYEREYGYRQEEQQRDAEEHRAAERRAAERLAEEEFYARQEEEQPQEEEPSDPADPVSG